MLKIYSHIKFALWYIFKAPQRKFGYLSLFQDLIGLFSFIILYFIPFFKLKPVSICVGIYNRSDLFLNHFLPSLNQIKNKHKIQLSVFDCHSNDVADLEKEIREIWKGDLVFKSEKLAFSRSMSFNKAVRQSKHEILFICDADFSLSNDLVTSCNKYSLGRLVWFPIVFYLYKNKGSTYNKANGEWMQWGGKGILACRRIHFEKIGGLDETFKKWGQEDDNLWMRFYKAGNYIIRFRDKGLLHHYHPSFNPKYQILADKADKGLL